MHREGPHFSDPKAWPPDTQKVSRYQTPVSFDWPVFKLAPGVEFDEVLPQLQRLTLLRTTFRSNFLRSDREEALLLPDQKAVELLGEVGVPLIWSYVSTETGIHTSYPGHGPYPVEYDPRQRPWYDLGRTHRGPVWGSPYIDVNGLGLLLPCVQSIWSDEGELLGVAGIELTFDGITDALLANSELPGVEETWLVDETGAVVLGSKDLKKNFAAGLHQNRGLELLPLPIPAVVAAITQQKGSGYFEEDGVLTAYSRLDTLGWYLVVTGDGNTMLED